MLPIRAHSSSASLKHGVPQLLERTINRKAKQPAWPELPAAYAKNLADHGQRCATPWLTLIGNRPGNALNCLQCEAAETSPPPTVHHILIQSGFTFPWADNLLVPAKSVLGCKELDTGERYVSAWLVIGSRWQRSVADLAQGQAQSGALLRFGRQHGGPYG